MKICFVLCTIASFCMAFQFDQGYQDSNSLRSRMYYKSRNSRHHKPSLSKRTSPAVFASQSSQKNSRTFLDIDVPPPKSLESREHGKIVLECNSCGNPAPQISWYKDGELMYNEHGISAEYDSPEAFSLGTFSEVRSKLTVGCASQEEAGFYECVAENSHGKTSMGTEVTVVSYDAPPCKAAPELSEFVKYRRPEITQHMTTLLQKEATDGHLICRSQDPHDTIWYGPNGEKILVDNKKYKLLPSGDLIIHKMDFNDMGLYKCRIENDYGDDAAETFVYPHAG